jgi:hypothetical protein
MTLIAIGAALNCAARAGRAQGRPVLRIGTLGDGPEFHYFPVIAVGHGVLGAYSGVLHDTKTGRAVVVQAETPLKRLVQSLHSAI